MNSMIIPVELITGTSDQGNIKLSKNLSKGMNSWKLDKLNVEEGWIKIPRKTLEKDEVQFEQIYWSDYMQIDTLSMIKIFISFICLSVFYSFVSWIKQRYA